MSDGIGLQIVAAVPPAVVAGESHLFTIDVKHDGTRWPYTREEHVLHCIAGASPGLDVQALGPESMVLHRFGGTYGGITYKLTADGTQPSGRVVVKLLNGAGITLGTARLPVEIERRHLAPFTGHYVCLITEPDQGAVPRTTAARQLGALLAASGIGLVFVAHSPIAGECAHAYREAIGDPESARLVEIVTDTAIPLPWRSIESRTHPTTLSCEVAFAAVLIGGGDEAAEVVDTARGLGRRVFAIGGTGIPEDLLDRVEVATSGRFEHQIAGIITALRDMLADAAELPSLARALAWNDLNGHLFKEGLIDRALSIGYTDDGSAMPAILREAVRLARREPLAGATAAWAKDRDGLAELALAMEVLVGLRDERAFRALTSVRDRDELERAANVAEKFMDDDVRPTLLRGWLDGPEPAAFRYTGRAAALIIGAGVYQHLPALERRDTGRVVEAFTQWALECGGVAVTDLVRIFPGEATAEHIKGRIRDLLTSGRFDRLYVVFSGSGGRLNEDVLLLPEDVHMPSGENLLQFSELQQLLAPVASELIAFLDLDISHSPSLQLSARPLTRPIDGTGLPARTSTLIGESGNSQLFAAAVVGGLRGDAARGDVVTWAELAHHVIGGAPMVRSYSSGDNPILVARDADEASVTDETDEANSDSDHEHVVDSLPPFTGHYVYVVTETEYVPSAKDELARLLGQRLASSGVGLVLGSGNRLDSICAEACVDALGGDPESRVVSFVEELPKDPEPWTQMVTPGRERRQRTCSMVAMAVVLLGEGSDASAASAAASALGRRVLTLPDPESSSAADIAAAIEAVVDELEDMVDTHQWPRPGLARQLSWRDLSSRLQRNGLIRNVVELDHDDDGTPLAQVLQSSGPLGTDRAAIPTETIAWIKDRIDVPDLALAMELLVGLRDARAFSELTAVHDHDSLTAAAELAEMYIHDPDGRAMLYSWRAPTVPVRSGAAPLFVDGLPVIGRTMLWDYLWDVADGDIRTLIVTGEKQSGKTFTLRLIRDLVRHLGPEHRLISLRLTDARLSSFVAMLEPYIGPDRAGVKDVNAYVRIQRRLRAFVADSPGVISWFAIDCAGQRTDAELSYLFPGLLGLAALPDVRMVLIDTDFVPGGEDRAVEVRLTPPDRNDVAAWLSAAYPQLDPAAHDEIVALAADGWGPLLDRIAVLDDGSAKADTVATIDNSYVVQLVELAREYDRLRLQPPGPERDRAQDDVVSRVQRFAVHGEARLSPTKSRRDVTSIGDLEEEMVLDGVVTNVTAFGAFVDVGVPQDGLLHVSRLARRTVRDVRDVVRVGDRLSVRVVSVDRVRGRISLSALSRASELLGRDAGELNTVVVREFFEQADASLGNRIVALACCSALRAEAPFDILAAALARPETDHEYRKALETLRDIIDGGIWWHADEALEVILEQVEDPDSVLSNAADRLRDELVPAMINTYRRNCGLPWDVSDDVLHHVWLRAGWTWSGLARTVAVIGCELAERAGNRLVWLRSLADALGIELAHAGWALIAATGDEIGEAAAAGAARVGGKSTLFVEARSALVARAQCAIAMATPEGGEAEVESEIAQAVPVLFASPHAFASSTLDRSRPVLRDLGLRLQLLGALDRPPDDVHEYARRIVRVAGCLRQGLRRNLGSDERQALTLFLHGLDPEHRRVVFDRFGESGSDVLHAADGFIQRCEERGVLDGMIESIVRDGPNVPGLGQLLQLLGYVGAVDATPKRIILALYTGLELFPPLQGFEVESFLSDRSALPRLPRRVRSSVIHVQGPVVVPDEILVDALARTAPGASLVVLSRCHSAALSEKLQKHFYFVVGTPEWWPEGQATTFVDSFYRALDHGRSIDSAFEIGRDAIRDRHRATPPEVRVPNVGDGAEIAIRSPADVRRTAYTPFRRLAPPS